MLGQQAEDVLVSSLTDHLLLDPEQVPVLFFLSFWPCHAVCEILVPRPGIEPAPPAVGVQVFNHWTTREVPGPSAFVIRDTGGDQSGRTRTNDGSFHGPATFLSKRVTLKISSQGWVPRTSCTPTPTLQSGPQQAAGTSLNMSVRRVECYPRERSKAPTLYNTDEP